MALTDDQQAQIDIQIAILTQQQTNQLAFEAVRHANQLAITNKQKEIDAVRIAQTVLIENARSKPVNEREITPADITTFANALTSN